MTGVAGQALAFRGAGCSVIRAAADGTKAPLGAWKQWQSERADEQQLHAWLDGGYPGIGIVCGAVSGNLDMLEFEGRAVTEGLFAEAAGLMTAAGLGEIWQRLVSGYMETSPSGGVHFCYRLDGAPVPGNTKLAERPAREGELTDEERAKVAELAAKGREWWPRRTLIETRGEGGFVVVAPSHGPVHPSGKPWVLASGSPATIPVLTAAEREELLRVIRSLDQMPSPEAPRFTQPGRGRRDPGGKLPGDDYNERADWAGILSGWTLVATLRDGTRNWRRPGKKLGMSATTGRPPYDNMFVFSTSTEFDDMKPYTKFGAYALLEHGGDYRAAAAQLRREGYGDQPFVQPYASSDAPAYEPGAEVQATGPRVVSLADVEPEQIEWLWDGYLPLGKLVILDGDPGVGKSTVSLDVGARITTGAPMPDGSAGTKGMLLVLSAEDGLADTIRPRLDAARADPASVITITEMTYQAEDGLHSRPVTIPGDLAAIERVITEHGIKLVIVDVLMAYLSGDVNAHRDQDIRRALHVLAALAERTRCCVIILRHLNKSGGENAIYRGGGSIGIIGAARAGFMCGRDPDDETGSRRIFAHVKMNIAVEPPSLAYQLVADSERGCARVEWLGVSEHRAAELLAEPPSVSQRDEKARAEKFLRSTLADGPRRTRDVEEEARQKHGVSKRTLERARSALNIATGKSGPSWWISLPEHEGDIADAHVKSAKSASGEHKDGDGGVGGLETPATPLPAETANGANSADDRTSVLWPDGSISAEVNR